MYFFRKDLKNKKPVSINVPHKKIMLCLNESSLNPFVRLQEQIVSNLKKVPFNRYYNAVTGELTENLAEYAGVSPKNIVFGNGADEMLYFIFSAVRDNQDSFAVSLDPSYFDYKSYSRAVGLGIKFLNLNEDFDFSSDSYNKLSADKNCKLAILCNPNNPTGNILAPEKILSVLENNRDRIVLLDETYYEFSGVTCRDLLDEYENLVIVRSFSKSFSAAGLRFGYLISNEKNIEELKKVMTVFHSSLVIQNIALTLLKNRVIFAEEIQKTLERRENLFQELKKIPEMSVKNTATNFLLFSIGKNSTALFSYLAEQDIAIRDIGSHPVLKDYLRVSIGTEHENNAFLLGVKEFLTVQ